MILGECVLLNVLIKLPGKCTCSVFKICHVDLHGLMHKLGQFDHDASFP